MQAVRSLDKLISGLEPRLNPGQYVFCTLRHDVPQALRAAIGTFREQEGTTVILERTMADGLGLEYEYVAGWITLTVHSALDAVGLTAMVAGALRDVGISCNVIAAYYHDHVFVGIDDADKAMAALQALSRG